MSADVGCGSRSAAGKATSELSRCFASLGLAGKKSTTGGGPNSGAKSSTDGSSGSGGLGSPSIQPRQMGSIIRDKIRSFTRQAQASQQPQTSTENTKTLVNGIRKKTNVPNGHLQVNPVRVRLALQPPSHKMLNVKDMWYDEQILKSFFRHFQARELCVLAQVCATWRDVLYKNSALWTGMVPVLHCRDLRRTASIGAIGQLRKRFYNSFEKRSFDSICLFKANDEDVYDFLNNHPPAVKSVQHIILRCCNISDKGLEAMLDQMQSIYRLELCGCNEITEAGMWAALNPKIVCLTISDCINIADESIAAIAQLLPSLTEFNLQAYHVTDQALGYFTSKQGMTMTTLRLRSCWELTNHTAINLVNTLSNLTVLSIAGCNKITDEGIELFAEHMGKLEKLDISWCPRITDASLEYIACDLIKLEELILDRCVHVTDIGIGYLSTMTKLVTIMMRWCPQIRDFGLQHLCSMRNLRMLSLAGCGQVTSSGLSSLIQLRLLRELELTNCPAASDELVDYLSEHLTKCLIIQ